MKIIDIGCGRKKIPGSIGIDFSDYAEVDIKLDLNTADLPFEENSVDFVHSSHCLEHLSLDGFLNMVKESYRVCKPDGTIFIAVPYFHTGANLANPFHNNNICFNEHTFRFFSSEPVCPALDSGSYASRSCPQWGLRYSANEELGIELRLNKVELIYFADYEAATAERKSMLRKTQSDIVENIHYWLQPVKPAPQLFEDTAISPTIAADMVETIAKQDAFLRGQITYLQAHSSFRFSVQPASGAPEDETVADFLERFAPPDISVADPQNALYRIDGYLSPHYEAIRRYDETIQSLRRIIDNIAQS